MKNEKLNLIRLILNRLNIELAKKISKNSLIKMEGSQTNQFMKVRGENHSTYLIRLNGMLWSPFSRANESQNLKNLKSRLVNTMVIYNNKTLGIQICKIQGIKCNTETFQQERRVSELLIKKIRYIHNRCAFDGEYPVQATILSSYKRLNIEIKKITEQYLSLVMSLIQILSHDLENHVASHNDLLLSSIYFNRDEKNVCIVDWEYSAKNHRSYDLAFFFIHAGITSHIEKKLIESYDPKNKFDTYHSVSLMKPVIRFLLITWKSPKHGLNTNDILSLQLDAQLALFNLSGKRLLTEHRLLISSYNKRKFNANKACIMTGHF